MKHTLLALAAAVCLTVPAKAEMITLASTVPNNGINKVMVDTLTEELGERLPDASLDIFLDGTLGGERELIDLVRIGETQIHMGVIHASEYFPNLDATLVPYLFPDYETVEAFLASETGDKIKAALEEKGNAKFLGTYYQGARWATANKPFTTLDELKGLKIRMPEIPLWIEIWSGLGAVTTPMPSPEVFSALQTGVIDAQENMISNIYGRRIYEVQKYLVGTRHQQSYVTVMANLDFWNGLSGDEQEALQAAVDAATAAATEAAEAENERIIGLIKDAGVEVVEPAPEFREKAMPVIEKAAKGVLDEGIYEAAVEVIEAQSSNDTAK
ncbi:TRAP transporter substrate-binding protein [Acuticoccus sediminis]|uniref:TRAP transporter substrate-binding protein n=1 Tax=Acuticoccus sediminis TaxID=2184697 RepID=UPI001CFD776C|nr:TRAP transporter substrate-binding protein [Acuticoccus sediminis]